MNLLKSRNIIGFYTFVNVRRTIGAMCSRKQPYKALLVYVHYRIIMCIVSFLIQHYCGLGYHSCQVVKVRNHVQQGFSGFISSSITKEGFINRPGIYRKRIVIGRVCT
ncbi:hypothetical protein D3C87_1534010 [compost metagenome]